jgi:hypothetical protein
MDEATLERVQRHLDAARAGRDGPRFEAALDRARAEVEALGAAATALEASLPDTVRSAVAEGLRVEVAGVARNLAEIRGLLNNAVRRLERIEQELLAERNARIEDLALLVDLVSAGWRSVDARLEQLEVGRRLAVRPAT